MLPDSSVSFAAFEVLHIAFVVASRVSAASFIKLLTTDSFAAPRYPLCIFCGSISFCCCWQVNYFPSRFDPVRHSEKYPYQNMKVSGNREKMCIAKENNFAQAGARWRSFDPARQDRFINRIAGMLTAPRVTQVCFQPCLAVCFLMNQYSNCLVNWCVHWLSQVLTCPRLYFLQICFFFSFAFVLQEVRRVWLGYMSQCDSNLGQKLAAKVQAASQM